MERLEAAIKKARSQQGQTPAHSAAPGKSRAAPGPVKAAWDALPSVALDSKHLKKNRIIALEPVPEATAFDVLRTRTLRHMQDNGWRRLAITSPTAGCGKSTLALNIGLSLSRQQQIRTICIELDMRRPSLMNLLGFTKEKRTRGEISEVASLMTGKAAFADVAVCVNTNLGLATSSVARSNASDILLDHHIDEVLKDIETQYEPDVMIFDMPPVLPTDDAVAFMQHVDCAMIIAAAEASTINEIDRCERELAAHTNVLGVVMNKCRLSIPQYSTYNYQYGD